MSIVLNGAPHEGASSLASLVELHLQTSDPRGVAVAVNRAVVPRDRWDQVSLRDGDVVDVVTAVQGG
jgi:sulfur carrier protein